MIYRFTFDQNSSPQVVSDPVNWNETSLRVYRDNNARGIFYKYSAKLEWVGSAYTYLDALNTASTCWELDVLVEYKIYPDDAFQTLFEGKMYSYNTDFDLQKQVASCEIVDKNLTQLLLDRQELSVSTASAFTVSGDAITPLSPTDIEVADIKGSSNAINDIPMYYVSDVLEYIVSSITDNGIAFESDFFSTSANQGEVWELDVGTVSLGATFRIELELDVGVSNKSQTFDTDTDTTVYKCLEQVVDDQGITGYRNDLGGVYKFEKTGTGVYRIYTIQKVTSIFISGGSVNTATKVQSEVRGMSGLAMQLGISMRASWLLSPFPNPITVSFQECIRELNRMFDVTFIIKDVGGTPTLKLERTADFFDEITPATVVIEGVRDIRESNSSEFNLNSINHSDGVDNYVGDFQLRPPSIALDLKIHQPRGYVATDICGSDSLSLSSRWCASNQGLLAIINNDDRFDEKYVLLDADKSTDTAKYYEIIELDPSNLPVIKARPYNGFLGNIWRQKWWMVSSGKDVISGDIPITNTEIVLDKGYEFTVPISQVEIDTILADPSIKINVSGEGFPATDLWIVDISVDVKTGMVTFKAISNE